MQQYEVTAHDGVLQYAIAHGMIDLSYVQEQIEMNKRKELLDKHPYKIWHGTDGNWHTYLPDEEKGRVPRKRSTEAEIQKVVIDYWRNKVENPTIREVFGEWNKRRLTLGKISPASYSRHQRTFKQFYSEFGKRRIKSVIPLEIEEFLESQISQYNLTAKAFSGLKSITKGFIKRAKKRGLIKWDVETLFLEMDVSDREFKKVIKEDFEQVFSEEEMPIVLDYLQNNQDMHNLCILLMFVTGIRIGEAVALRPDCIGGTCIKIRRTETKYEDDSGNTICEIKDYPKTDAGVREVVIPSYYSWIPGVVLSRAGNCEYIFNKKGKRLTAQAVRRRLERICKNLGIYPKSPHDIRRTYGSILLDNHIDNRLIIQQMGHTGIDCTETYYHRNRRTIEKKKEILSNIPDFKCDMRV